MSTYPVERMIECPHCGGRVRPEYAVCRWCKSPLNDPRPPKKEIRTSTIPRQPLSWSNLDKSYREHIAWKALVSPDETVIVGDGETAAETKAGSIYTTLSYGINRMANPASTAVSSNSIGVLFIKTGLQTIKWGQSEVATADGILVGASGTFGVRLVDPQKLLSLFPEGQAYLSQNDLRVQTSRLIGSVFEDLMSQTKWLPLLIGGKKKLAEAIAGQLRARLAGFGLELYEFEVSSFILPEELRRALEKQGIRELETRAELEKLEQMRKHGYDVNKLALVKGMAETGAGVSFVEADNYVHGTNIRAEDSVLVRPDFGGRGSSEGSMVIGSLLAVECPKCQAQLEASRRTCDTCGTRFGVCPKDRTTVAAPGRYCHQCGGRLI